MGKQHTRSQKDLILKALKSGHRVTPIDALNRYGCFRLAARIAELRSEGHDIQTTKAAGHAVYRLAA